MRKTNRINAAVAGMETLEGRQMLSASAFPIVKAVPVTGGLELKIVVDGGENVKILPATDGLTVKCNGQSETLTGTFVSILARAETGDNKIVLYPGVTTNAVLRGGSGNDTLVGGSGEDELQAGTGQDSLVAGTGTNTILALGDEHDTVVGGGGLDSIWVNPSDVVTNVSAAQNALGSVHDVSDVPSLQTGGLGTGQEPAIGLSGVSYYSFSSDPLFSAAGPSPNDVVQGDLGDCYFMATMAAVAKADPSQIYQDVVQLGDGTFLVGFHSGSGITYEHVDAELPAYGTNEPVYAGLGQGNSLWVAILEKAFAVYRNGADSYSNISSGWMDEVYYDLGLSSSDTYAQSDTQTQFMNTIQKDLAKHQAVTAGVLTVPSGVPLIGDHAYNIDSVTMTNGVVTAVTLRNPWGTVGVDGLTNGGYVTITAAQAYASLYCITSAAA